MCGIAGFSRFRNERDNIQTLNNMGQAMFHRGPDAGDSYFDDDIALIHRRLSIIDLSDAGIQPMHTPTAVIVFNGEIYNYQELKIELKEKGYNFSSETDTEVILALYQEYGVDLLEKINGMFAFAIWDKLQKSLFIARDRLGKKPLYYTINNNNLCFASELKSLLEIKTIKKQIRVDAVYDFFAYQYIPDPKTIFQDIYKLEPGHYLTFDHTGLHKKQYWDISFASTKKVTEKQAKQLVQDSLRRATKQRMISDVPLGAFLSGGIDSSAITSLMSEQQDTAVTTCNIGFKQKAFNESEFAKQVAEHYSTNHYSYLAESNIAADLKNIVRFFDEPFADPSLLPTYYVAQLAKQKVTVAIAGDGGDEMLAGYEKYKTDAIENKIRDKVPNIARKRIFPKLASLFSTIPWRVCKKAATLCRSISYDADFAFYQSNAQITDQEWQCIANKDLKRQLGNYHPSHITTDFYQKSDANDHLGKILYTDIKTYLPGDILVKVDRMSMANSLEVRAPMLDFHFAELCASLPSHYKLNDNLDKKHILKQTFKDRLPENILNRKKMGFSPPLADWLRDDICQLTKTKLFDSPQGIKSYFNVDNIQQLWQQHQTKKADHSAILWSLLMFQFWWDEYMGD